jgi:CHAT domain-containing protein
LLLLEIAFAGCGCRRGASPDATIEQIRDEMRRGQWNSALIRVDAALTEYQAGDTGWAARFRVVKARILMARGSYSESLHLLDEALPQSLARTDTEVERKMVQALDHTYLQQFEAAELTISQAEELGAAIHTSLVGAVAQTRGILESDRKNYPKAVEAFRTAAAIGRERNLPRVELDALGNLGYVAMSQEHYDEAVDRFRMALEKSRAIGAADVEARTLGNLGWSYSVIGDFENAEASFKDAQAKAEHVGLVEDQTYWLTSLAEAFFQQRRYAEADATAQKALALARSHDDKRTLATCLNTLSEIALATDRLDEAEKLNREAIQIENAAFDYSVASYSQLIAGRIEAAKQHGREARTFFQRLINDPQAQTQRKWEAHGWLAVVYAREQQPAKAEQEFKLALRIIQDARSTLQHEDFRVSFLSSAILFYEAYVNFLVDHNRSLDALKIADLSRSQTLELGLGSAAEQPQRAAFNPKGIARSLNATLLFYWLGQEHWLGQQHSYLWIITASNVSLLQLPPSSEVDPLVRSYRESFAGPRDPLEAGNPDGQKLYAALVQATDAHIPKNSRVIVLPDGSLNSLNFETLIVSKPQPHYWIEDVTLLTANSLSLLARSAGFARPKETSLLLVGDAVAASPDFPPLPQAGKEVGLLEKYFTASDRVELIGRNATPSAFLASQPERFSYLHFATHGTASRLRPLESAVILSPDADSYKLYARDILQHPLKAYLVTISACNGAGTKTYAGEGLVGLSWAFLRAGAHHVIAGLWEVSNASTPQLMDELYKGIQAGEDPATALRKAKLTLVHSSGNYRKPFYWAPFQLYLGS